MKDFVVKKEENENEETKKNIFRELLLVMPINKKINNILDLYHSLSYLQNNSFLQLWNQDPKKYENLVQIDDDDKNEKYLY